MRSKLICAPYLDILAHQFLPDRSGKPIPSWRSSSAPGCGRRRRRTAAALLQPAGGERMGSELGVMSLKVRGAQWVSGKSRHMLPD